MKPIDSAARRLRGAASDGWRVRESPPEGQLTVAEGWGGGRGPSLCTCVASLVTLCWCLQGEMNDGLVVAFLNEQILEKSYLI